MTMRTPLKTARYLGSAKEGADHFWKQRGYDLKTVDLLSWGTLVGSLVLTALIWIGVAMSGGL